MLHIVQYTIRRTGCVQKHKVVSTAIRTAPQNGLLALLLPGRSVLVYINIAHSPGVTGCASSKIVDRIDYLHWLPFQCQVQRQSYLFSRDVQVNPLPQHGLDWSSKFRSEVTETWRENPSPCPTDKHEQPALSLRRLPRWQRTAVSRDHDQP